MNNKAFTLVELMVVIVIIGILTVFALPKFSDNVNSAKCTEVAPNAKFIIETATVSNAQTSVWPSSLDELNISMPSQYWTYDIATAENDSFFVVASLKKSVGKLPLAEIIKFDNYGNKEYLCEDVVLAKRYLKIQ